MGRKSLLNISMLGSFVSLLAVGYGLDSNQKMLASVAIIIFVASFACGMGPVPFVVISDIAPYHVCVRPFRLRSWFLVFEML